MLRCGCASDTFGPRALRNGKAVAGCSAPRSSPAGARPRYGCDLCLSAHPARDCSGSRLSSASGATAAGVSARPTRDPRLVNPHSTSVVTLPSYVFWMRGVTQNTCRGVLKVSAPAFMPFRAAVPSSLPPSPAENRGTRAGIALAPATVQCIPNGLQRSPITVLQPASTTPEPTHKPCCRNSA